MGPDFGIGFFDPNNTNNTLVKNQNNTALIELEPGSFTEPTTIVLSRNSDNFRLTGFDGDQFPPYFDYNAVNASGNHILENGKTAIVGFCLLDPAVVYPENPAIGHNPVQINKGAPSGLPTFEILDPVDLAEEGLALQCGNLHPNSVIIGGFGQGLPGLASAAWTTAKYYLSPVAESLLLPQALYAATMGMLPPPGGRASKSSPLHCGRHSRFLRSKIPGKPILLGGHLPPASRSTPAVVTPVSRASESIMETVPSRERSPPPSSRLMADRHPERLDIGTHR